MTPQALLDRLLQKHPALAESIRMCKEQGICDTEILYNMEKTNTELVYNQKQDSVFVRKVLLKAETLVTQFGSTYRSFVVSCLTREAKKADPLNHYTKIPIAQKPKGMTEELCYQIRFKCEGVVLDQKREFLEQRQALDYNNIRSFQLLDSGLLETPKSSNSRSVTPNPIATEEQATSETPLKVKNVTFADNKSGKKKKKKKKKQQETPTEDMFFVDTTPMEIEVPPLHGVHTVFEPSKESEIVQSVPPEESHVDAVEAVSNVAPAVDVEPVVHTEPDRDAEMEQEASQVSEENVDADLTSVQTENAITTELLAPDDLKKLLLPSDDLRRELLASNDLRREPLPRAPPFPESSTKTISNDGKESELSAKLDADQTNKKGKRKSDLQSPDAKKIRTLWSSSDSDDSSPNKGYPSNLSVAEDLSVETPVNDKPVQRQITDQPMTESPAEMLFTPIMSPATRKPVSPERASTVQRQTAPLAKELPVVQRQTTGSPVKKVALPKATNGTVKPLWTRNLDLVESMTQTISLKTRSVQTQTEKETLKAQFSEDKMALLKSRMQSLQDPQSMEQLKQENARLNGLVSELKQQMEQVQKIYEETHLMVAERSLQSLRPLQLSETNVNVEQRKARLAELEKVKKDEQLKALQERETKKQDLETIRRKLTASKQVRLERQSEDYVPEDGEIDDQKKPQVKTTEEKAEILKLLLKQAHSHVQATIQSITVSSTGSPHVSTIPLFRKVLAQFPPDMSLDQPPQLSDELQQSLSQITELSTDVAAQSQIPGVIQTVSNSVSNVSKTTLTKTAVPKPVIGKTAGEKTKTVEAQHVSTAKQTTTAQDAPVMTKSASFGIQVANNRSQETPKQSLTRRISLTPLTGETLNPLSSLLDRDDSMSLDRTNQLSSAFEYSPTSVLSLNPLSSSLDRQENPLSGLDRAENQLLSAFEMQN
ncbi:hypothetical protein EDD86DRAFT_220053 [Gorgonomyces haynaldii]|nr:hypothetical protein EDD86DRAFT_220053 [Gorgonomyces haynaldii]